jgi:hypothetical protein
LVQAHWLLERDGVKNEPCRRYPTGGLGLRLGLRQIQNAATFFPQTPLFEEVHTFKAFKNVAFGCDGARGTKATMLGHNGTYLGFKETSIKPKQAQTTQVVKSKPTFVALISA